MSSPTTHNTPPSTSDSAAGHPTPYHRALLSYLRTEETELWNWFSSNKVRTDAAESVRLDLLKSAYRIDRESAADLYRSAERVAEKMQLTGPVTMYQSQQATGLNASLAWLPNELHVVFHGPVQETLTADELTALLAHEFAHHELYALDEGAHLVVEHILNAMIRDPSADAPHHRTWQVSRLYTELYCDRRAAQVTGDIEACVRMLVKMETGLKDVSAAAYLQQADEVLAKTTSGSEGSTHPEMYVRARALRLERETPDDLDDQLVQMVEGPLEMKQLDLLRQRKVTSLTRTFIAALLDRPWLQTDLIKDYARRFFEDFEFASGDRDAAQLADFLNTCDPQLRQYFCCLLLDFVTCDAVLEDAPLAAAFLFAAEIGLSEEFRERAARELKLGKRALQSVETEAETIVARAATEFGS